MGLDYEILSLKLSQNHPEKLKSHFQEIIQTHLGLLEKKEIKEQHHGITVSQKQRVNAS